MKRIIPIDDRVVIKPIDAVEETAGGVIIPDIAQESANIGKVLQVGPGKQLQNGDRTIMQTWVGATVVYPKGLARKIEVEGEDFLVISERELLTILEEE